MHYSILGPFNEEETKSLIPFIHTSDQLTELGVILEIAGLYALQHIRAQLVESQSYHGWRLLTIFYKEKRLVMCQAANPFRAYYVGESKQMNQFKTGFYSFYETLEGLEIDFDKRFRDGLEEKDVIEFIEDLYSSSQDYEGISHTYKALTYLGINYDNGYLEMEKKFVQKLAAELKKSPVLRNIIGEHSVAEHR